MTQPAEQFIFDFLDLPENTRLDQLAEYQQLLITAAGAQNTSAKAVVYAFLDRAWNGGRLFWMADAQDVDMDLLAEVRKRDLLRDPITDPWHIDVLYGAWFATREANYLRPAWELSRGGGGHDVALTLAAQWSLESLRAQFPAIDKALLSFESESEAPS